MTTLDWLVLLGTISAIVGWGLWKERNVRTADAFLTGGHQLKWWGVGLSVMATQASAITFLSMPGQAYTDGMGFVQFYFGQPVGMVLLSALVLPVFYRLKVTTAYEYLETRFDRRTRQLVAALFLISRGLATGIAIYAPAIVLSTVLGWSLQLTNLIIGGVVILYTVAGGARVVSRTQTYQMVVMLGGMAVAAGVIWSLLPAGLTMDRALTVAGTLGKMQVVDYSLRLDTRYTFWSGMTGGLFVALAYFGTDQSQVQRYLGGASLTESRLGLLFNGLFKVPMQFLILFVGVLLFVFYQFERPPVYFDSARWQQLQKGEHASEAEAIDRAWASAFEMKRERVEELLKADASNEAGRKQSLREAQATTEKVRADAKALLKKAQPNVEVKDADYIFIDFVVSRFPPGLVGLLLAVILCAAMSAVAAALSSLSSTTIIDFYRVSIRPDATDTHYLRAGRAFMVFWGLVAMLFAAFASQLDNLIQAVNILGSIFYGPMLGVFLTGLFLTRVRAGPVFWATLVAQATVIGVYFGSSIGFLWYNVIGCVVLMIVALLLNALPTTTSAKQ